MPDEDFRDVGGVHFVEIKWSNQIRPRDLKELMKYDNSMILAKDVASCGDKNISVDLLVDYLLKKN